MRPTTPAPANPSEAVLAGLALVLIGSLAGCGGSLLGRDEQPHQRVEPTDFVLVEGEPSGAVVSPDAAAGPAQTPSQTASQPGAGSTGRPARSAPTFRVVPGAPMTLADASRPVEAPRLLDAKVGDINGRPVFASRFLDPISGRLRAEAEEMGREAWMRSAAQIIQEELRGQITDELLRAEGLNKLSVEEKAGLRRFLQTVREDLISQNLGSRELAARRLQREQGLTEEEYLRRREERTLVRYTIQEEISNRVNVSWRDIVRRYRRDEAVYNPDPVARFRLLRIDGDEPETRAEVERALASGTPFADLAESELNTWTIDPGGLREVDASEGLEEVSLLRSDELNEAARGLDEGGTAGPIEVGSSLMWVHLERVEQDTVPLYEAQLPIAEQIRSERTNAELQAYIDRLLGRASVTDIERMLIRLLTIATDRYAPAPDSLQGS